MRANEVYTLACQRGLVVFDTDAPSGELTKRLVCLLRVLNRRYTKTSKLVSLCVGEDVKITDEFKELFPRLRFIPMKELNEDGEFTTDFVQQFHLINKPRLVLGVMPPIIGAY